LSSILAEIKELKSLNRGDDDPVAAVPEQHF
jgi:hypothetical protein